MKTNIKVWSQIGATPITKRGGAYCDLLVDTDLDCATPAEASALAAEVMHATPGGASGYFVMPEYWNQNTRSGWL